MFFSFSEYMLLINNLPSPVEININLTKWLQCIETTKKVSIQTEIYFMEFYVLFWLELQFLVTL